MSVQSSQVLSSQIDKNVIITDESKIDLVIDLNKSFHMKDAGLADKSTDIQNKLLDTQEKLQGTQEELPGIEKELLEAETLQNAILIDEDFDFNLLDSPAAGQSDTSPSHGENTASNESLSTVAIIESSNSQIEFHASSEESFSPLNQTNVGNVASISSEENTQLNTTPQSLGASHASTTEDFKIEIQGQADSNFQFISDTHNTDFGSITYNEQGQWQYQLDNQSNAVQSLGAGDTLTESIQLISKSGAVYSLDITINGTNDQAILSGSKIEALQTLSNTQQRAIEEDDGTVVVETSGQLSIQDNDAGEARFVTDINIPGTYGNASINAQGEWHYTLDHDLSAVKGLTTGEHLNDHFAIKTLDGTSQLIQITIHGADDKPFLSGENLSTLELTLTTEVEGTLTINDPDFGQSYFLEESIQTNFGTGSIDENGHWHYQVDSNNTEIQSLADGAQKLDTFTVHTADGTEQTIIIPIGNNVFISDESDSLQISAIETESIQFTDLLVDSTGDSDLDSILQTSFGSPANDTGENAILGDTFNVHSMGFAAGNTESVIYQQLIQQGNTDIV